MFKKFFPALLLFSAISILPSCEEEPPFIDFTPKDNSLKDTSYIESNVPAAQPRNVLIEDFTGVRCNNCPNAQAAAAQIATNNPGRVAVMALHPSGGGFAQFTTPYSGSYDFRTTQAEEIMTFLTPPPALPSGVVNRKKFAGESARMIEYTKWESHVLAEMGLTTPVNIEIIEKKKVNDSLLVSVKLVYTSSVAEQHFISVALTESHIVAPQKMPDLTTNYNYEHNHVLRSMGTLAGGQAIAKLNATPNYEPGRVYIKQFKIPVHADWKLDKCHIVAIVSMATPDLNVVHVAEAAAQ